MTNEKEMHDHFVIADFASYCNQVGVIHALGRLTAHLDQWQLVTLKELLDEAQSGQ